MLRPIPIPALLVLGTDTEVGKTVIAGAIADWFRRRSLRVAVCKPCATGCVRRREGLVSEDAEFLAHCADARFPLDVICPQRYVEPLAPAVAAERAGEPIDWTEIDRCITAMSRESDVMIVEGIGGLMVPMDARHTFRDVAVALRIPAVIVARPDLGTINHTLLTIGMLRQAGVRPLGVIINRYPPDGATVAQETNPAAIERWGRIPVLCVAPQEKIEDGRLPPGIVAAIETVNWAALAGIE